MKLTKLVSLTFTIMIGTINLVHAQNEIDSKQAIQIIKQFYIAYNTAWSANVTSKELDDKLSELKYKYCAVTLWAELEGDLDHDILINDQYTDVPHLKTLTVSKNPKEINSYRVTYIAPTTDPFNKPIEEKVVINLSVMKGARGIVIECICD
jgi:hypothetical protein